MTGPVCGQPTDWPGQPCGLSGGHPGGHLPQVCGWVRCSRCGKRVSNIVTGDLIVRAWVECPECIEGDKATATPRDIESMAAQVHDMWMAGKHLEGVTSHPAAWGEELMVPYADLTERAKDIDRRTVAAVCSVIRGGADHVVEPVRAR